HRMKHKDGQWRSILATGRFSEWDKDGNPTRLAGTQIDVSELENTKQKLSLLYQNSPFGFAFCNLDGDLLDANDKFEKMTGYTLSELKKLSFWDLTPKEYKSQEADQISALKRTGKYGPYRKEYRKKNGERIPVELNGFIVKDLNGTEGLWSIAEDITEKLNQEEEVHRQKQIASHQSKLASIGELAAGVGHEINNPLAIVKGYLATIDKKIENRSLAQKDLISYLTKVDVAINRIAKIVQGLRTFSRSDTGDLAEFSAIEAVEESLGMIGEIYSREGIQMGLSNQVHQGLIINGNRGQFQQVLMNLLSNAKDATVNQEVRKIDIKINQDLKHIVIEIKDNGCGIPLRLQERIFDPFFTTKEVNKGTGIGLSLVHNFVKDLNGSIRVETKENEGSSFILQIPIASQLEEAVQKEVKKTEPSPKAPLFNGNVLIADDDEGIRDLLSEMLKDLGLNVTAVEDGSQAYDLYLQRQSDFDLII
ncbi:MAG: PAS domain S-box protein, partial [Bdellovibrionales bacterium]|nr:PAS domain S-box protein [Bdellovibrionales bacterium]